VSGQNATVEEILASIRQAISEDDAKRTQERQRADPHAAEERGPVANVSAVFGEKEPEDGAADLGSDEPQGEPGPDHDVIEKAIEQALIGVRAELEGGRSAAKVARLRPAEGSPQGQQRAIPRATRPAPVRREVAMSSSPRRALLSPRAETQVSGSFDDLAKAMIEGNSRKLDEVVEELLRPMLKGWLEGNLPQMVERMVREEIERVSRGRR